MIVDEKDDDFGSQGNLSDYGNRSDQVWLYITYRCMWIMRKMLLTRKRR